MRYHWEIRARDGARQPGRPNKEVVIASGGGHELLPSTCFAAAQRMIRGASLAELEGVRWSSCSITIENVAPPETGDGWSRRERM